MEHSLYDPVLDNWRHQAKCKGMDTELWFPPRDKNLYKPIADQAKAICLGKDGAGVCPVRVQCLLEADANDEVHGIWGGMSHRERNALKRKAAKKGMTLKQIIENPPRR